MTVNKVWYVTGSSTGMGLDLVVLLLNGGYQVAAATRNTEKLISSLKTTYKIEDQLIEKSLLALKVDIGNEESVKESIKLTIAKFKQIDVVVNNAGYSQGGAIEEVSDKEVKENFDVNVFGLLNVIRCSLPYLKESAKGKDLGSRIYNISSIVGFTAFASIGIYCATKFAVTGISESLAQEVLQHNIYVTHIDPGYFRTEFLSTSSFALPAKEIEGYENVRKTLSAHVNDIHNNQLGDPKKAMAILIKLAEEPKPPVGLFLGSDAVKFAENQVKNIQSNIEQYKQLSSSTDF